jgi:hypothetical protein
MVQAASGVLAAARGPDLDPSRPDLGLGRGRGVLPLLARCSGTLLVGGARAREPGGAAPPLHIPQGQRWPEVMHYVNMCFA